MIGNFFSDNPYLFALAVASATPEELDACHASARRRVVDMERQLDDVDGFTEALFASAHVMCAKDDAEARIAGTFLPRAKDEFETQRAFERLLDRLNKAGSILPYNPHGIHHGWIGQGADAELEMLREIGVQVTPKRLMEAFRGNTLPPTGTMGRFLVISKSTSPTVKWTNGDTTSVSMRRYFRVEEALEGLKGPFRALAIGAQIVIMP